MTLKRRTPLKAGAPLKRSPFKRKKSQSKAEFHPATRAAIVNRSRGFCEANTLLCQGFGSMIHHIRRRSQGGDGSVANGLHVCGVCHTWIHEHPAESAENGWLILRPDAG